MADTHHVPELDGFDRLTVRLYRTGLSIAAVGLGICAVMLGLGSDGMPGQVVAVTGVSLSVANLHLYDRRIRWLIVMSTQLGVCGMVAGVVVAGAAGHVVSLAGLGFVFVALSGLALKEQFCFRVPFLRAVPAVLALSLVPLVAELPIPAAVLLGLGAVLVGVLAAAKARMPLHFDIGDKSRYQT